MLVPQMANTTSRRVKYPAVLVVPLYRLCAGKMSPKEPVITDLQPQLSTTLLIAPCGAPMGDRCPTKKQSTRSQGDKVSQRTPRRTLWGAYGG